MTAFWPGCGCCGEGCLILSDSFTSGSEWSEVGGAWSYGGTLNGSSDAAAVVSNIQNSGSQWVTFKIRANAADQVAEVLLLTNSSAATGIAMRLTFGDSGVSGDCGTIQFFEDTAGHTGRIAVDDPQPVPALIDGVWINVTVMLDVPYGRMFAAVDTDTSPSAAKYVSLSANVNPTRHDDRLGFVVVTGQGSSIDVDVLVWDRLVRDETTLVTTSEKLCHSPDPCASESPWVNVATGWPWASFDTGCAYTLTGTSPDITKIESQLAISDYDRSHGYGVQVLAKMATTGAGGTFVIKLDNLGHEARFYSEGPGAFGTIKLRLRLYKGATLLTEHGGSYNPGSLGPFTATVAMCGTRFAASVSWGASNEHISLSATTTQNADGNAHEATVTGTGSLIQTFLVKRCQMCTFCAWCDDLSESHSGTVVIDVSDPAVDGTYIVSGTSCSLTYSHPYDDIEVSVAFGRNWVSVTLIHDGQTATGTSVVQPMPVDCEGYEDEPVMLSGDWTGTAEVTTL